MHTRFFVLTLTKTSSGVTAAATVGAPYVATAAVKSYVHFFAASIPHS